ncbi:MAG: DNA mismatch repair endonuclease MutL, partial [Polyangiaceae bacterium]|nr:DNA mismatch repair endonuclease MutL [Polyangiaceae bacterium]
MTRKIEMLSADLASQIAAGEVVERPASVAKELIENSLDAGARRIRLEIEAGGIGLLRISDDGHGMSAANAQLCLKRHATSKLRAFDELEALATYGFRGEALPSVASVSRMKIETREAAEDEGHLILAEGTTESSIQPIGHPVGATIE